ncbi:MAG: fumarylacetoacetate hydrolase family protein [Gammaproteobacteria bacterium]|nr:fumarylacetoacetate hydrolase family protein [Gammaproteobacteria bacterium]
MVDHYLFPARPQPTSAVVGSDSLFPVHRIFCVGRNYHAHAAEMGASVDKATMRPFYFTKHPAHLLASGASIDYPPQTANYHHEVELVVAIGKTGFEVAEAAADELIFGYAVGLDMTRRDLQAEAKKGGRPWDLAKDFEDAAVLSPIVPKSQTGLISAANIELSVNGEIRQKSDISKLIWNIQEIIADLSKFYHLQPGDLIYTGTPDGVGPVVAGDRLSGKIDGVGTIELSIKP